MKIYFLAKLVIAAAVLIMMLIVSFSCGGPKTYEFQYSVDVKYTDSSVETLVGTDAITTDEPEKVVFTITSRFRDEPCLSLGLFGTNVACGVKSFKVNVLTHTLLKRVK
jgi:hypothetical protein